MQKNENWNPWNLVNVLDDDGIVHRAGPFRLHLFDLRCFDPRCDVHSARHREVVPGICADFSVAPQIQQAEGVGFDVGLRLDQSSADVTAAFKLWQRVECNNGPTDNAVSSAFDEHSANSAETRILMAEVVPLVGLRARPQVPETKNRDIIHGNGIFIPNLALWIACLRVNSVHNAGWCSSLIMKKN